MKLVLLCIVAVGIASSGASGQDSARTALSFSGCAEVYYGFDFNQPKTNERPPFVYTHNRHNEVNVNLAMLKGSYAAERVRANVAIAAGTYMNAVYAAEQGVLKNIFETNIGVKLSKRHSLWLDAGVMPSHIGFESVLAADCATLTRSMIAENSPYYESGARLSYTTTNERWYVAALALNGWQRIQRSAGHTALSAGSQVTYKLPEKLTLNYSNFAGNVWPDSARRYRVFHNVYGIVQVTKKVNLTAGADYGVEQRATPQAGWNNWIGTCLVVRYAVCERWAAAVRGEYYNDDSGTVINTGLPAAFRTLGFSANVDCNLTENVLWRIEGKTYISEAAIYKTRDGSMVKTSPAVATSLCVHF